jgi:hypothetical protein
VCAFSSFVLFPFIKPSDRWKFTEVSLLFVYSENGWFYDRFKREQKESRKGEPEKGEKKQGKRYKFSENK